MIQREEHTHPAVYCAQHMSWLFYHYLPEYRVGPSVRIPFFANYTGPFRLSL